MMQKWALRKGQKSLLLMNSLGPKTLQLDINQLLDLGLN